MKRLMFFCLVVLSGCAAAQNGTEKVIVLDFRNTLLYEKGYNEITIEVPRGPKKKRVDDYHGYREYRFKNQDGSIFYITTDIYSGSYLNAKNRMSIGINAYTSRSLNDTIRNAAQQTDGRYWLEYILGDVVVGYVNVPAEKKIEFDKALATLRRKK